MSRNQSRVTQTESEVSRRQVLRHAGTGFGYLALAGMLGQNVTNAGARPITRRSPFGLWPPNRRISPSRPSGSSFCS